MSSQDLINIREEMDRLEQNLTEEKCGDLNRYIELINRQIRTLNYWVGKKFNELWLESNYNDVINCCDDQWLFVPLNLARVNLLLDHPVQLESKDTGGRRLSDHDLTGYKYKKMIFCHAVLSGFGINNTFNKYQDYDEIDKKILKAELIPEDQPCDTFYTVDTLPTEDPNFPIKWGTRPSYVSLYLFNRPPKDEQERKDKKHNSPICVINKPKLWYEEYHDWDCGDVRCVYDWGRSDRPCKCATPIQVAGIAVKRVG